MATKKATKQVEQINETDEMRQKIIADENTLDDVLDKLQPVFEKIEQDKLRCEERKDYRNYDSKYAVMISAKLNAILRKKQTLFVTQADMIYNDINYLHQKISEIYDLVACITIDNCIPFIIDKQTICAYMRVGVDYYQLLLNDATYEMNIRNEMKSLEDMLLSMYQQSAENNLRNFSAVKYRLGLKSQYGGNEVEEHEKLSAQIINGSFNESEVKAKLKRDYNFELEAPKEKKESEKK